MQGAEAGCLRQGYADGATHARQIQPQQLAGGHGGADAAGDAGAGPGHRPFGRRHGQRLAEPAGHLDPQGEREQQLRPRHRAELGHGQRGGGDRTARVHHGLLVRVVEAVYTGGEAIDQGGVQRIGPAAAAQQGGVGGSRKGRKGRVGQRHGVMPGAAEGAADDVEESAQRFLAHRVGQVG